MRAVDYDWTADQGSTFDEQATYRDANGALQNWTGWSARMQLRADVTSDDAALDLTTANGRIVLGGAAGTVRLLVDAATMTELAAGVYLYDLEVVQGASVFKLMRGKFTVIAEVTR